VAARPLLAEPLEFDDWMIESKMLSETAGSMTLMLRRRK
jgi:hypothetical protein